MHESKHEEASKDASKSETTYELLVDFMKLFLPNMFTQISVQAYFIMLLISRNFDSTEKMAAVGLGISILTFYEIWLIGVTTPNLSLTA